MRCVALLRRQPQSALAFAVDPAARKVTLTASGLDRIDAFVDGHPAGSFAVGDGASVAVPFAASAKVVDAVGFAGEEIRQRRRISVKA
jgi:hypothetical protein